MAVVKEFEHLRIPFLDIKLATKNFTTLIGVGGYGSVFRGELSLAGKLTSVAVKRLPNINLSGQGLKEFLTEIHMLSRYKHPNLVTLLGFCEENDEKILIYKYAERGSFDNYLNPAEITCPLTWKQRINICIDAASGLDHLHNHIATNHRIIHRDIKSANLLLDLNWNCMIADFGLSKIGRANENETYLITNAGGTHGYCDPVYIDTGILTKKSDVYSFGVVLFEALCGRLCFKNVIGEHRHLVPLARRCYQEGKLNSIMDLDLKNSESMKEFSEIAYRCLHDDPKERPSMDWVLRKLEKTLELLESEEACEAQKLEEALGLQIFVESMQVQEFVEALVSQELEEALEWEVLVETMKFHKVGEILELQNYALIKALHMMTNTLPTCATREEVYAHLSTGVLVDDGKVWFSIDKNGKNQEMVSAMKFLHLEPNKCEAICLPESRFPAVANILNATNANIQLKIRTQFLSSDVTYAVYLLCKHRDSVQYPVIISVKYKLNNHRQSYFSFPGASKDGWSMMELCHTNCLKRDVELEVFLEEFYVDISQDGDQVIVEGILFLPIQKFEDEKVKTQEKENLPTSEIDWENRLPVDYKQFIYYRGKKMGKKAQNCVITESKEEAYSILTKGVSIMLDDGVSAWFWITKSNQKKCFMLSANSIMVSKHHGTYVRNPHESRFKYTLHVKCSNRLFMSFKIRNPLLSFKTAYGCYLVYQMSEPLRIPLEVSGGETNLQSNHRWYDQKKLVYLSTPQIPVIGSEDLEQISHSTMNKTEMIGYPRERTDGWWEVRLGEFITHDDVFKKSQRRICMCIPSFPDDEATNTIEPNDETTTTIASLFPGYKPEISFGMSWPRSQRTYTNFSLSFRVQGIEFRPL